MVESICGNGAGPVEENAQSAPSLDLSVVILSYNVRAYLALAIRTALQATRSLAAEIIVVDNASQDGSADMVAADFPEVRLIRSDRNLGFSGGNNLGIRVARGRYVLLLNPDVIVHPRAFEALVAYLDAHPSAGAAGGRVVNPDGTTDRGARRGFPSPSAAFYRMVGLSFIFPKSRRFARYNMTYHDDGQECEVDAVSGCFMAVRREVVERIGLLDENFFMYGEDLDWSFRIRSAGWTIGYVPSAEIVHFRGESTRSIARLRQLYLFHRAMHVFVRKHIAPARIPLLVWLIEFGIVARGAAITVWRVLLAAVVPIVDVTVLTAGFVLALFARTQTGWSIPPFSIQQWFTIWMVFVASGLLGAAATGLYVRNRLDLRRAAVAAATGAVASIIMIFLVRTINFSRIVTLVTWALGGGGMLLWRWLVSRVSQPPRAGWLVLGCGEKAQRFLSSLSFSEDRYHVLGVVRSEDDPIDCTAVAGFPVVGSASDLPILLRSLRVDDLIVAKEKYHYHELLDLVRRGGRYPGRVRIVADDEVPFGPATSPDNRFMDLNLQKRTWFLQ
ncbi:MAG: N-acetylglucosaminyl-diphospho-decaprenol L-rhamnosyltransferase [Candidatus Latescibacteria bacterium ADurb.Bin168]|nr:MAG: N-acetylglucosaminyl-diphospho-decaprenol L-rhamnosyltransferase [Candidatus Latescibacteria bacterium ADurb.Bin168]